LALISWIAAAVLALMLLIGPKVIAEDKGKPPPAGQSPYAATATTAAPDGKALFSSNCGSCHTLSAAGTNGRIGPKLDGAGLDDAAIETIMNAGPGAMPSFSSMPPAQRHAIAGFVERSSR
jgi:mono/diheme cytochrome c family protein